jgi:hypothetical protein
MRDSRQKRGGRPRSPAVLVLASVFALVGSSLPPHPALAAGGTVLILGTTVTGGTSSLEAAEAAALGFTVEVVDAAGWAAKTTADFATYSAIVLGDPTCATDATPYDPAVANKTVWGPAVTGNVIITGNDPISHQAQGGDTVVQRGIAFATAQAGKTGAYISLGCSYTGAAAGTAVPVLDAFSPSGFTASGIGCFNSAHVVASDPSLAAITDATLSNWECSAHEVFGTWPVDFLVFAILDDAVAQFTASDGTVGDPYILARGPQLSTIGLSVSPTAGSDLVGTAHTVTTQLHDATGSPVSGSLIRMQVTAGPNAGTSSVCVPVDCHTDAAGQVAFTYIGAGAAGTDSILVFVDANSSGTADPGEPQTTARETWNLCGDGTIQSGEECDPAAAPVGCSGNLACLPTCTCGCLTDANCDDGNACNGPEQCNTVTQQCVPGTPPQCDDGNPCNGTETCDPASGCQAGTALDPGTPCEKDGNPCTLEACDDTGMCQPAGNAGMGAGCDDGVFCNGADTCDGAGACVHAGNPCNGVCTSTCTEATDSCFDPPGTLCDDGDPGTLPDICDGAGTCRGNPVVNRYAVLRCPAAMPTPVEAVLGRVVHVVGNVCADTITARQFSNTEGTAIAPKATGTAMVFGYASTVTGAVVTGGGAVQLLKLPVNFGGGLDPSGLGPELAECAAAGIRAGQRRAQLESLPVTAGLNLPILRVPRGQVRGISAASPGVSQIVISIPEIHLAPSSRLQPSQLQIIGGPDTREVVIHVPGVMRLGYNAKITLQGGLTPEQVIFLVDGPISTRSHNELAGTLFGGDTVRIGWFSTIEGAVIAKKHIQLAQGVTVMLAPFVDW